MSDLGPLGPLVLKLRDFAPHMTHVEHIPMVIIALYLKGVQFGELIIPFMLVKCIRRYVKENITLIIYSVLI